MYASYTTGRSGKSARIAQGNRIVLDLAANLDGRNISCDNLFTSHRLAVEIKKQQITLVGPIRKNLVEMAPAVLNMKHKPQFHSESAFDHSLRATFVSYVLQKRHFEILLSMYHTTSECEENDKKKLPEILRFYKSTTRRYC